MQMPALTPEFGEEPLFRLRGDHDTPILHWDDVCISDSDDDDDDDVADLDDLVLDDDQVVTDDEETNCQGKKFPMEKARLIDRIWVAGDMKRKEEHQQLCKMLLAQGHTLPPFPMKVLPQATGLCVLRGDCYHRRYKTHDTSTTKSTIGFREPHLMLQFFSLCLSTSASYPVSVYGIIAVRDELEPMRNHLFNRPCRDDAVTIDKDSLILPLCSPRRGMYLLDDALVEVDLWVKEEGDGSADKQILSAYAEIEGRPGFDKIRHGHVRSGLFSLDISYILSTRSVEAVIQVFAEVDGPHHLRFAAFSSGFDHEIVLFDDKFSGTKVQFQHVVVVKAQEKLDVCLKLGQSLFWWTFQDGYVGAVRNPDDFVSKYGQFDVRVFFAPKNWYPEE
ncbi:uncharacterized protein LOC124708016 [Lolium rigidum]|uniref:uncharacterized protein LOC124708016 n=1 Tax=Lolium rigidum TaxID=89674 RepID=UPI001F5CBE31|nr:uncharacterized protein LOC124708016 [Lolium rigidum]